MNKNIPFFVSGLDCQNFDSKDLSSWYNLPPMNQTCDGLGMSIFSLGRLLGAKSYRKDHRSAGDSPFSFLNK